MKKKVLVVLCSLLMVLLVGCGEKEINLEKYVVVNLDGPNGYATASIEFDYLTFADDLYTNTEKKNISLESLLLLTDTVSVSSEDILIGLSNNDIITYKFNWDANLAKEYGFKFVGKDYDYIVSNLKEPIIVDPFEHIELLYSGVSPNGDVTIAFNSPDAIPGVDYTISPNENLSNGDTITVLTSHDSAENALKHNYILSDTEKEFIVEGLPYYVTAISDIPNECLESMKKQTEDVILATVMQWEDTIKYTGCEFLGNYLLVNKNESSYNDKNICYCVYKINGTTNGEDFSYYYYVSFTDIMVMEDGAGSVNLMDYSKPFGIGTYGLQAGKAYVSGASGEAFVLGDYWYVGYMDLGSMFNYCVTQNIEQYTYETNVAE